FQLDILIQHGLCDHGHERANICYVMTIEFANDIAWLQLGLCRGRSRHYAINHDAFAVRAALSRLQRTALNPKVTAYDSALFQQAFQRHPDSVRRNRETQTLRAASRGGDHSVDAD